jgi:hypothetical protein
MSMPSVISLVFGSPIGNGWLAPIFIFLLTFVCILLSRVNFARPSKHAKTKFIEGRGSGSVCTHNKAILTTFLDELHCHLIQVFYPQDV